MRFSLKKMTFVCNELGRRRQPKDLFACSDLNTVIFLSHSASILRKPSRLEAGERIMCGESAGRGDHH